MAIHRRSPQNGAKGARRSAEDASRVGPGPVDSQTSADQDGNDVEVSQNHETGTEVSVRMLQRRIHNTVGNQALLRSLRGEEGDEVAEAVQRTTERTGRAILYTSAVLLLGFGVLYTSAFPPNHSFAVLAGSVIFVAVIADLFVLPALLLLFRPTIPGTARLD